MPQHMTGTEPCGWNIANAGPYPIPPPPRDSLMPALCPKWTIFRCNVLSMCVTRLCTNNGPGQTTLALFLCLCCCWRTGWGATACRTFKDDWGAHRTWEGG